MLTSTPSWFSYVADGTSVSYAVPMAFFMPSDLEVYLNGNLTTAYTTTGGGGLPGTITFYAPPPALAIIMMRRVTARTQLIDFVNTGPFLGDTIEGGLDRLTAAVLDLLEELSRRPTLPLSVTEAFRGLAFPVAVPSQLIGWNANGTALTLYPASVVTVTPSQVTGLTYGKTTAAVVTSAGAWSLTAAGLIPAAVRCLGVTYHCTTTWANTNGLTGLTLGGMGQEDGWGINLGRTSGTVSGVGAFRRGDTPIAVGAEDVTLLAEGGPFAATGGCNLTAHWVTLTPD